MLFKKGKKTKRAEKKSFDRERQKPVLKCSICNGEQVAGFKDIDSGKFHEVAFIRNDRELKIFMEDYGIDSITKEY
ncbi:MAG: aspartate dehydrogenase [Roseburia sp.]|nr:aspartate dehydrogenase [Roseburia sp.]